MPVHVKKTRKKYCVVDQTGKVKPGRCHATRRQAIAQTQAINLSLIKQGKIKLKNR